MSKERELLERALVALDFHCGGCEDLAGEIRNHLTPTDSICDEKRKPMAKKMTEAMKEAFPFNNRDEDDNTYMKRGIFVDGWISAEIAHGITEET